MSVTSVLAHVTVKPAEVGVGQRVNFAVSVPTEGGNPTIQVRLIVPTGLQSVRPNAKPGWNIEIVKAGESMKGEVLNTGEKAPDPETVTELIWSGGNIPVDMRDEFVFSAQVPAEEGDLNWLAYQTYSDGTVIAWDAEPQIVEEYANANPNAGDDDHNAPKPYSTTKVINDLKTGSGNSEVKVKADESRNLPLIMSAIAVILSGLSVGLILRKNK